MKTPKKKQPAKPFLKWAGGKTQLLPIIKQNLPITKIEDGTIKKYVEPFVGSGAVLFEIMNEFPQIEKAYIFDINPELINVYISIKENVEELVFYLKQYEEDYLSVDPHKSRKEKYYEKREQFNEKLKYFAYHKGYFKPNIERAAQFIFLNKTCFNGLYRVNKKGEFNVPMGQYKNPKICNQSALEAAHEFLNSKVEISLGDYRDSNHVVDGSTFVYFDPPYRPISKSSSFTSYSKFDFNDENQKDLSNYFNELNAKKAYLMLSNSDPKNIDPNDNFFDELYKNYQEGILRVSAKRSINSIASKRGEITELLIKNYYENGEFIWNPSLTGK